MTENQIVVVDPQDSPAVRSPEYNQMASGWTLVNDLKGGTPRLRQACETYLPRFPLENKDAYAGRVRSSVLYPAYKHTVRGMEGMVFRKNLRVGDDVPVKLRGTEGERGSGIIENVDLQGTHLDLFARQVFRDSFDGHSFILVDMPKKLPPGATYADEKKLKHRPRWIRYRAEQAVNWEMDYTSGVPRLGQITFEERVTRKTGTYSRAPITRWRVLRPGSYELFEEREIGGKVEIVRYEDGETSLKEIPVSIVYGEKLAALHSEPPLLDLAYLNIAHFQLKSDLRNILHVANVPILVRINARVDDKNKPQPISSNRIVDVQQNGDLKYVEHNGRAVPHARTEVLDLQYEMSVIGLSHLARKAEVEVTATESLLDAAETTGSLSVQARSLQDGLEGALAHSAQFMGLGDDGGSIAVNKNFQNLQLDAGKISALSTLVEKNQLSILTMWALLERAEELPDEFNAAVEQGRLRAQIPDDANLDDPAVDPALRFDKKKSPADGEDDQEDE